MNGDNQLWLHDHQGTLNGMPCILDATIMRDISGFIKIAGTAIIKATEATAVPALDTLAELSFTWNGKVQRPRVVILSWEYNSQLDEFETEFTSDPHDQLTIIDTYNKAKAGDRSRQS